MTTWREVEDLNLDEEFDEYDPMAAPTGGLAADAEEDAEQDLLARPNEPWTPAMGFPDGYGVLRVWADESGLITKVRLSPSWRERLGKAHLSMPFAQAFALINSHHGRAQGPVLSQDDTRQAAYPLSWERLDFITRQTQRLSTKLEELGPGAQGHWESGGVARGQSVDKLVAIELNEHGELGRIIFNTPKLAESRVRQITEGVVRAHAEARASFVPPTYVEGEADRVVAELTDLRNEMLAMMRRGFK